MSYLKQILNKNYYIYIVNNIITKNIFIKTLNNLQTNNTNLFFDFEFNNKNIGLCQTMINNNIYLYHPEYFNNFELDLIKYTLYLSNHKKILHGSVSQDIPYIYNFLNNKQDIIKFTSTIYDTKFMFENIRNKNDKCSLYEALKNSNTINNEQYNELLNIYNNKNKSCKSYWNVFNMPNDAYLYAAYDVIYLDLFYNNMIKNYNNLIINDITKLIFLERNNITHIIKNNKSLNKSNKNIKYNFIGLNIDYFRNYLIQIYNIYYSKNNRDLLITLDNLGLKYFNNYLLSL